MRRVVPTLIAIVVLASTTAAQESGQLPARGSEMFRFALHKHQIEPVARFGDIRREPAGSMIVILGDLDALVKSVAIHELFLYLRAGGSILLATDANAIAGHAFDQFCGVAPMGIPLVADLRDCYRNSQGRPFVRPRIKVNDRPSPLDIFKPGEDGRPLRVATNNPSEVWVRERNDFRTVPLATYPDSVDRRGVGEPQSRTFAVSLEPLRAGMSGRMLVMGDQSVFTNGMMGFIEDRDDPKGYRLDNDNWTFTNNTIDWLQGGGQNPRTKCLFIENGEVIDQFAVRLPGQGNPKLPKISPEKIANIVLNAANGHIDNLQEKNYFNRVLEALLGLPRIIRFTTLVLTGFLAIYALRWLIAGRGRIRVAATMTAGMLASLLPRGSLLRQRTRSQIDTGNLYETARKRVRSRFDPLGASPGSSGDPPPILTASDLRDAAELHLTVRWLWVLGYGTTPVAVPLNEWDRVNLTLEKAMLRAHHGDWSFGVEAN